MYQHKSDLPGMVKTRWLLTNKDLQVTISPAKNPSSPDVTVFFCNDLTLNQEDVLEALFIQYILEKRG